MPIKPELRIEIAHDILAEEVYSRISSDEKMRLKVRELVKSRYEWYVEQGRPDGALLTQNEVQYVEPYRAQIRISPEEAAFIDRSVATLRRAAKRM